MESGKQLKLEENPTPGEEASDFSTPDERAEDAKHRRVLKEKEAEQGPIGKLIGSSDSSLTICFALLVFGGLAILISLLLMIWVEGAQAAFEKLVTFELTVAGYVMGKRSA